MSAVGRVVWNGDKHGANRGLLALEAHDARPAAPTRDAEPVAERLLAALRARPEGWLQHELARHLGVDTYHVNHVLHRWYLQGRVQKVRLASPVWTGRRWATLRYVWSGDGRST